VLEVGLDLGAAEAVALLLLSLFVARVITLLGLAAGALGLVLRDALGLGLLPRCCFGVCLGLGLGCFLDLFAFYF
jgi:hypothetical protein